MYITVYAANKPVYVCDNINDVTEKNKDQQDVVFVDDISVKSISSLIEKIYKPEFSAGILMHKSWDELLKALFKSFKLVQTGGGLIINKNDEVLLIFRRGKWDLPKGKLDEGETLEQCALREVEEETGLKQIDLGKEIRITYHIYNEQGNIILKEAHWFNMTCSTEQGLTPQTEEQITDIRWVKQTELEPYLENTFPTIADVLSTLKK